MEAEFLAWAPIFWTARVLLLIMLVGGGWCALLYFIRFFRWRSIAIMWNARLPKIKKFGGRVGGNEIGVELDENQDRQFDALATRVDELAIARTVDREAIEEIVRYLIGKEAQRDIFDPDSLSGDPRRIGGAETDRR